MKRIVGILAWLSLIVPLNASAVGFTGLGVLTTDSGATDVSANGVVVGWSDGAAFRWTPADGMVSLGATATQYEKPIVSGNGKVVAGLHWVSDEQRMFRWTATGGVADISPAGEDCSRPSSISADGSAVTGLGSNVSPFDHHCRWSATAGYSHIGGLPEVGQNTSRAMINLDGTAVVATSHVNPDPTGMFWTLLASFSLCDPDIEGFGCFGTALNQAANVVVGVANSHGFRWTVAGGREDLGDLPGGPSQSLAAALDAGGIRVVGWGSTGAGHEAMQWDATHGMRRVIDVLATYGVTLPVGWTLREVTAISSNGRFLVGTGDHLGHTEAWRADLSTLPWLVWHLKGLVVQLPKWQISTAHRQQLLKWLGAAQAVALLAENGPVKVKAPALQTVRKLLLAVDAKIVNSKWVTGKSAPLLHALVGDALLWTPSGKQGCSLALR